MSIPKVSIVVPVYNKENYLVECLESLINQTLSDIEIICVDDGSTDGSPEILKSYAQKDSRIKLIHQENQGVSVARNKGIERITGKYLLFVDPDDFIKYETVEILYNAIEEKNCDILLFGHYNYTEESCQKDGILEDSAKFFKNKKLDFADYYKALINISLTIWGKLYKSALILNKNILFPVGIDCSEDRYFIIKSYLNAQSISVIDEFLYYYRANTYDSLTKASAKALIHNVKANLLTKELIYSSNNLKNKDDVYKEFLYEGQNGMLFLWNSVYNLCGKSDCYKYLKLYLKEYKPFLKDKNFNKRKYNILKNEIINYKKLFVTKLLEPVFELEERKRRRVLYLFGHQVLNYKKKDKKMDFKEYFETYNAQEKINKLAKTYKNRKIVLYGAGQYAQILFQNYDLSKLNIVAICDKKFEDESKRDFYNLKCIPPQELGDYDCNLILISNFDYERFLNIVDDILYETKNESVEIRPLIKLNFADLFLKKM